MELKSGEKIKFVRNGACLSNENKNCMPLATGKVGENEVEVLRDTGCNGLIVRRELVKKEDFTGSMGYVMAIHRTLKEAPIVEIKVDTPYYTGVTQAICLRDPLFDLVIGNIPGARNLDDPVPGVKTCAAAVTRAQARKDITVKPLVTKEVTTQASITKNELAKWQQEDATLGKNANLEKAVRKEDCEIMSRCEKGNDYRVEVNKKVKICHANMLKKYIERDDQDGAPQRNSDNKQVVSCDAYTGIIGGDEDLSVNDEEMMELANCHQKETVKDVKLGIELTKTQQEEMMDTLVRYEEVFSDIPGKTNVIEHKIEFTNNKPVRSRPYPLPYALRENLKREIQDMLSLGIIRESNSSFASPIVIVKKKDGSDRICIDYRKLNKLTVADPEPMVTAEDLFQWLGKSKYYSKIDLSKGYWQIPVTEEDIEKTAFITPDGTYDFLRMPFGMKNSGATLVRGMRKILAGMNNVDSYIDDLIIHTNDWQAHLQVLGELLRRLREAGLRVRPSKCVFGAESVEFLGHYIGRDWITINEDNLEKIRTAGRPTTKKEVRSFLGLANYYRAHIPTFAAVAVPLTDLTRKGQPNKIRWGQAQEKAFSSLQDCLLKRPILRLPDHSKPFILRTDASNFGLGAALMQQHDEKLYPVAYASKKLAPAETRHSTLEKECLGIVWGVKRFQLYLTGKLFILQTDHQPLAYINKTKYQNDRIMQWALALQGYDYTVQDIPGKDNATADYLNRVIN